MLSKFWWRFICVVNLVFEFSVGIGHCHTTESDLFLIIFTRYKTFYIKDRKGKAHLRLTDFTGLYDTDPGAYVC